VVGMSMRSTINLDDAMLAEAKQVAARRAGA
jgi:Arc/MetJ family transcription regulator